MSSWLSAGITIGAGFFFDNVVPALLDLTLSFELEDAAAGADADTLLFDSLSFNFGFVTSCSMIATLFGWRSALEATRDRSFGAGGFSLVRFVAVLTEDDVVTAPDVDVTDADEGGGGDDGADPETDLD